MTRAESDPPDASAAKRQRIAKLMARAGLCSRRDAEAWIAAGRVTLNGVELTSPAVDVSPEDVVLVDGAPLPAAEKTRLFLFHKLRGQVTTDHDPEGRKTVADHLRATWPDGPRVVTVGRLDINTEGLLLLTNDGGLARVLELPQTGWLRRYRVRAKGVADPAALDALADGVTIDGIEYSGIEAKLDRAQGANTWLTMGLREGKNREIKRVLEHLGLEVNRLIRLSFGPFQLLDLPEGAVEEVRTRVLRDQLGAGLAAEAGVDFGEDGASPVPPPTPSRKGSLDMQRRGAPGTPRVAGAPERSSRRPRPDDHRDEPPPKRERPASGPRKHVSTLRAERVAAPSGTRTRIERSDTRDRRDRTVKVERLVPSGSRGLGATRKVEGRSDEAARPPRPKKARRFERETGGYDRRRDHGAQPERRPGPSRGGDSPSATGKRERIARSGGRSHRSERPDRRERVRSSPPAGAAMRDRDTRKDRLPSRGDHPDRKAAVSRAGTKPSSRKPRAEATRGRPSGARDASRGPKKGPRTAGAEGAKPASRASRSPKQGGRKPPRGPSKPRR